VPDPLSWSHDGPRSVALSCVTGTLYVVRDSATGASLSVAGKPPGAFYGPLSRAEAVALAETIERDRVAGVETPSPFQEVAK
jgi:hypothetical protein